MQAKIDCKIRPTQGTPVRLARPTNSGALQLRDMIKSVRGATYREPFPAEMTLITIRALIRCVEFQRLAGQSLEESLLFWK
jgi:hypothetical protein